MCARWSRACFGPAHLNQPLASRSHATPALASARLQRARLVPFSDARRPFSPGCAPTIQLPRLRADDVSSAGQGPLSPQLVLCARYDSTGGPAARAILKPWLLNWRLPGRRARLSVLMRLGAAPLPWPPPSPPLPFLTTLPPRAASRTAVCPYLSSRPQTPWFPSPPTHPSSSPSSPQSAWCATRWWPTPTPARGASWWCGPREL